MPQQTYIDWELVEERKLSFRSYRIFKVVTPDGNWTYMGYLDNDVWQFDTELAKVRSAMYMLGNVQ